MTRATVSGVLGRTLAMWLTLLAACYSPAQPDCGFECDLDRDRACPPNYACASDNICHRIGAPADLSCAVDARPGTPPPIDAPPADAADMTPPAVVDTEPMNGDANVATSATIRVELSEPVIGLDTSTFDLRVPAIAGAARQRNGSHTR